MIGTGLRVFLCLKKCFYKQVWSLRLRRKCRNIKLFSADKEMR
nr:MAG TPA: hypothetical protein [Caudoviricetes sp.]